MKRSERGVDRLGKTTLYVPDKYFNPAYHPFAGAEERYQFFYGGAGSGKSAFVASRVALDTLTGRNTLVVRQVAGRIRTSCYNEIRKAILRMGAEHLFVFRADSIRSKWANAEILFSGLDDVEKVKSITPENGPLTDIWVEEATEVSWSAFRQLDKRLRGLSPFAKRMTLTFNPSCRAHWLYRRYFEGKDIRKPLHRENGLLMLHTTYRDNLFLSPDDGQALEREGDDYQYRVYTLGEWGRAEGAVLTNWRTEDLSQRAFPPSSLRVGVDFGFSADPAAALRLSYDAANRRIYILEEIYRHGLTNDCLAALLRPLCRGLYAFCDSAEPKSIAELRAHGVYALAAKKGRDSLWHSLQWLRQHEIVADARCANLIREIEGYCWQTGPDGVPLPRPRPGNDHLIDALRYALSMDMEPKPRAIYRAI